MYYIITNGKYWVIENPIRPGEYMESTKSSNAKQFTFKQAKNLLNARSKKLGWIRNGYSMVGEDGNKPTVSPKAKGNGGVFLNENDIVVDLSLLDQIEDECTKFLSLAAWDESELSNMLESLSTYLSKLDSEESDIKHALVIYTYKHDGKLPQEQYHTLVHMSPLPHSFRTAASQTMCRLPRSLNDEEKNECESYALYYPKLLPVPQ